MVKQACGITWRGCGKMLFNNICVIEIMVRHLLPQSANITLGRQQNDA